jgi:hypothetical protein
MVTNAYYSCTDGSPENLAARIHSAEISSRSPRRYPKGVRRHSSLRVFCRISVIKSYGFFGLTFERMIRQLDWRRVLVTSGVIGRCFSTCSVLAKSASSSRWLRRQNSDQHTREAKLSHYKSRAAFKLLELNKTFKLFKPGMTVVDLVGG